MTRFQFRLERVLRWRALQLSAEEIKLKRLMQEAAAIDALLERIRQGIAQIPIQLAAVPDLRGTDLACFSAYAQHLSRERTKVIERRQAKQREILKQAEVHRAAKQRCKLLEELKRRRQGEWQQQADLELDQLAHESYLARWQRG